MGSTAMYLTSLIAALSLITASSGNFNGCGEDGSVKPDCRQRPIGIPAGVSFYMPHEFECSLFWECGPDMVPCLFECPRLDDDGSLFFNTNTSTCDWPQNVNCGTSAISSTSPPTSPPVSTTTEATTAAFTSASICNEGWTQHISKCYRFFHDRHFWFDAQSVCESYGGNLATVPDAYTTSFVMSLIEHSSSSWVLIGGIKVNDSWTWIDGTPWEYMNWADGRPDDHLNIEDCLNIYANNNFKNGTASQWNDLPCNGTSINGFSGRQPYLCSVVIDSLSTTTSVTTPTIATSTTTTTSTNTTTTTTAAATTSASSCNDGWMQYKSKCYRFFTDSLFWVDAQLSCWSHGGVLASIPDSRTNTFVMSLISNPSQSWVLIGGIKVNGSFTWTDGTHWGYENWADGRPDNLLQIENCVNMYANNNFMNGSVGQWNDLACEDSSLDHFSGKRPYVCSKDIGVEITTTTPTIATTSVVTNTSYTSTTTTTTRSPDTSTTTSITSPTATSSTTTSTRTCEDGWTEFESMCYQFSTARLSWTSARLSCQAENADLPSIPDESTNDFLMELIKDSSSPWVLVGGQKVNGSFSWVDGTPWEYQRWGPGRPDNN